MEKEIKLEKVDPSLNKKTIIHKPCGKKHIDRNRFANFNHQTHLCNFCNSYFEGTEKAIGI